MSLKVDKSDVIVDFPGVNPHCANLYQPSVQTQGCTYVFQVLTNNWEKRNGSVVARVISISLRPVA